MANNYVSTNPKVNQYATKTTNYNPYNGISGGYSTGPTTYGINGVNATFLKPIQGVTTSPTSGGGGMNQQVSGISTGPTGGVSTPDYSKTISDITSAWDQYLGSLGGLEPYYNDQQSAQTNIANTQFQQGQSTLEANKASSLRDIANTTRNAFQAGNNYLGQMGAGDSSAAHQYDFAVQQQASKQTGDLNNFVAQQTQQLQSQHDTQINQIAQWFSQKQQELKQMIAQGQLQKGQDLANLSKSITDQAIQATNALKADTQNQYNALVQWAANNSTNVGQLGQNIAAVGQQFAPGSIQTIGAQSGGNIFAPQGGVAQKDYTRFPHDGVSY